MLAHWRIRDETLKRGLPAPAGYHRALRGLCDVPPRADSLPRCLRLHLGAGEQHQNGLSVAVSEKGPSHDQ